MEHVGSINSQGRVGRYRETSAMGIKMRNKDA
jgi:hypothetical protein